MAVTEKSKTMRLIEYKGQAFTPKEITEMTGISKGKVNNWIKRGYVVQMLDQMNFNEKTKEIK